MLQQGIIIIMWGSLMPELIIEFSLSEASAGTVLGLGAFGFFFGPLLSGPAIDRTGLKLILLLGFTGELIFLLMLSVSQWYWMLVFSAFMINLCCGFIQTAGNVLPNRLSLPSIGSFMNLVHFVLSFGSFLTPSLIGWYVNATGLWRAVPVIIALSSLPLIILTLFTREGQGRKPLVNVPRKPFVFMETLRDRSIRGGTLTLFCYVGGEVGFSAWVVYYLRTSLNFSPFHASAGLSVLWMGLMIGRFVNTFLSKKFTSRSIVTAAGTMGCLSILLFLSTASFFTVYALLVLIGLCMSGIFPTVMAEINHRYPESTGAVTATLALGASFGSLSFQWLIGVTAEHTSITWALTLPALLMGGVAGAFLYTYRSLDT